MSIQATLVLNLTTIGNGLVNQWSAALANAASPGSQFTYALSNGFNTLNVPAGAVGLIIVPPTTNTNQLTLKGVTGDTGQPINPASPTVLSLFTGASVVGITANGATTIFAIWF